MKIYKAIALFALLATLSVSALACNTVKGAGKDIQEGGEAIEEAADSAQK
ncbi:MAG TPA: entericidin A/B family lipoprotein [Candidatus Hydrogenedentes bacterium]|nr:entericidin A/B family lipoprotein [Candidatus Hydrogenedentota bacterium]